ncbi:MAG: metallophosphoesterase [Candidatus Poribacteria bacterium]|nr:metallophosphoesterase [Candidatus Poribacteria bacterium]
MRRSEEKGFGNWETRRLFPSILFESLTPALFSVFRFLSFAFLCCSVSVTAEPKQLADYPNRLTRDGELVVLPDHGTVYIATDFHTHWNDFNQWLMQTKLVERIESGEDVYGLIIGDAVDHKPGDAIFEPYGDAKIVDRIMQLQQQLGTEGERLIYLKGNHEFAATDTYALLKKNGMNADNRRHMIDRLYRSPQGAYFQQFNFIERMTESHYDYLIHLPTVAVGKNGFVGTHAGTSRLAKSLADLASPSPKVLEELLWARPAVAKAGGYTPAETNAFLERIGGRLLTVGHTPLGYFPKKNVKDGVARLGKRQLIFATGYGAPPGVPVYLMIDLSKRYESAADLKYGIEIQPLYPK